MKRNIVLFTSLAVLMALAAFAPSAHARSSARKARMQACSDKSAGDPCSYTSKGESVSGTCEKARRNKLICTASSAGGAEPSSGAMNPPAGSEGSAGGAMGGGTGAGGSPSTGTAGGAAR